jgi:hypothetical protein
LLLGFDEAVESSVASTAANAVADTTTILLEVGTFTTASELVIAEPLLTIATAARTTATATAATAMAAWKAVAAVEIGL